MPAHTPKRRDLVTVVLIPDASPPYPPPSSRIGRTWPLRRTTAFSNFPRRRFRGFLCSLLRCGVSPRLAMILLPTSRLESSPPRSISSSGTAIMPAWRRYLSSLAARLTSRAAEAATYSSSSGTCAAADRCGASSSYIPCSAAARSATLRLTPFSYLLRRSPSVSRSGTSCSPLAGLACLGFPPIDTASTSLCLLRPSSSSTTSTKSATSSPKSPTSASEFIDLVVALARRRSTLDNGTRVKRSSSILARASMRANSRLANALDMSPSSPPSSSGASPNSWASSLMRALLDARRRASFSLRFSFPLLPPSSKLSIAVGSILGGRYTPPAAPPSSASSSTLLTSASGLGRKVRGSSPTSSPALAPSLAILRSFSI
mmetsp:Transcript_46922/g.75102  ORF Transcript_46922/g.75102 Transcript_46922/m.75102 type:complete len:374 (-) Transcript_46922:896-2017(-)